ATKKAINIDTGIANLKYNNQEVLAVNGDKVESFVPKESTNSNGKFVVVEREKKSLTTSPVDISIIDSVANRTYPGAVQL
ncbi:thiol-activated cytolysin family protein, partial [Bacillus pseudomycoides]